jgi:cytochrome c-type biogenesis protein CcmE
MTAIVLNRKQKRLAVIGGIGLVLALALALILTALSGQIVFFYTPSEILAKHVTVGTPVRLGGEVKTGSWVRNGDVNTFTLSDSADSITVHFAGILPDLFREGQGIVAEGSMAPDGTFKATNVLAKHDENYIPKQIVDDLKAKGEWRPDEQTADAAASGALK